MNVVKVPSRKAVVFVFTCTGSNEYSDAYPITGLWMGWLVKQISGSTVGRIEVSNDKSTWVPLIQGVSASAQYKKRVPFLWWRYASTVGPHSINISGSS